MKDYSRKRRRMRELYVSGKTLEQIGILYGVGAAAIQHHKTVDLRKGIDWDALRIDNKVGEAATDEAHRAFLGTLIACWQEAIPSLADVTEPKERLEMLRTYSKAYMDLMRAIRSDPQVDAAEVAAKTLEILVDYALETNRADLASWLQESLDAITARVRGEYA